jgi:Photosynthesis system II assembly factor YCF48
MSKYLALALLLTLVGCSKESITVAYESLDFQVKGNISSIVNIKDSVIMAVGGNTWENGFITESFDKGKTWTITSNTSKQLYDIKYTKDHIYTTGIDGFIYQKSTSEKTWNTIRTDVWNIMKSIAVKEEMIYTVGGASFGFGLLASFDKNNKAILRDTFKNELTCIKYYKDHFYASGYGIVLQGNKEGKDWKQLPIYGDFFKSFDFNTLDIGIMIGTNGTILQSTDAGNNWSKLEASADLSLSDQTMNKVRFVDENNVYIVGNQGLVWKSINKGIDWVILEGLPKYEFTDLCKIDNKIILTSNQGKLVSFVY